MMGAQQMKPYHERLIEHIDQQKNCHLKRTSSEAISQQVNATMHDQSISSVSSQRQCITVADFARIKREPPDETSNADLLRKNIKIEYQNISQWSEEITAAKDTSSAVIQESCGELSFISIPAIETKQELLATHAVDSVSVAIQKDALPCEVNEDIKIIENSVVEQEKNKSNSLLQEAENDDDKFLVQDFNPNSTKLVKNPLAFLKKTCAKNQDQTRCLNTTIKSEPIVIGEELENTTAAKTEIELQTTSPNELFIKSEEPLIISETHNEETLENTHLYQTCLSYSLDSSMDVNLSHVDTDLDDGPCKHLPEDLLSNISVNTTPQSIKYITTIEISSEEDNVKVPLQSSRSNKINKTHQKRKAYKKNTNKDYKLGKRCNFQNKQIKTRKQGKRLARPKTRKCATRKKYHDKDSDFKIHSSEINRLKNVPAVKTRKSTKEGIGGAIVSSSKAEFPKPLKLETENSPKDDSGPVELPKPMKFKSEFVASSKYKRLYLKPEFQPLVRLKRLKSEELLVPLRTRCGRRARTFQGITCENRHDFRIQQAYSLNPIAKYNRLNMDDHDPSFGHEQRSLNSRYLTSCSLPVEGQNESVGEMESNYFSAQERYTFFHSSTPDASSMFSGPIDSGVSTSTPTTSHRSLHNCNKSLLLQIAAERAFINNHLMQFGHSPIQFDLYNNLNELIIFLKFLFGNMKTT